MSKFLDILDECCQNGGKCMCKQGKKCDSSSCKCKNKRVVKEALSEKAKCPDCGLPIGKSALDFGGKGRNGKFCACAKPVKESKFDQYVIEQVTLSEQVDIIFEKLGSLEPMDAKELGLPGNTPITSSMIIKAFKKIGISVIAYIKKIKSLFVGITSDELASIKLQLDIQTGSGSYIFGKA